MLILSSNSQQINILKELCECAKARVYVPICRWLAASRKKHSTFFLDSGLKNPTAANIVLLEFLGSVVYLLLYQW